MVSFQELKRQRDAKGRLASTSGRTAVVGNGSPPSSQASSTAKPQVSHATAIEHENSLAYPPALAGASEQEGHLCRQTIILEQTKEAQSRLVENCEIEVDWAGEKGRGLFYRPSRAQDGPCTAKISRGTVLFRLTPSFCVPLSSRIASHCHYCLASAKSNFSESIATLERTTHNEKGKADLFRCTACHFARYCDEKCQRADWPLHRLECRSYVNASTTRGRPSGPGSKVRLLARLAVTKKRDKEMWTRIESLSSYRNEQRFKRGELELEGRMALAVASFLCHSPNETASDAANSSGADTLKVLKDLGFHSPSDLIDLVCRLNANSITVTAPDLTPVGICLSATAALLNHSCQPNAVVVFPDGPARSDGGSMAVVAVRDIAPGEELTTSYLDVTDSFQARQSQLQEFYSFHCRCKLCHRTSKRASHIDAREARWCGQTKGCTGWYTQEQRRCSKCERENLNSDYEEVQLERAKTEACEFLRGEELSISEDGMPKQQERDALMAWQEIRRHVNALSNILPPSAYPLLSLLRAGQTALISLGASALEAGMGHRALDFFEEATRFAMLVVAGMQARDVLVEGHPARAIAMLSLAKLLLTDVFEAVGLDPTSFPAREPSDATVLHRPPILPPRGPQRILMGRQLLEHAIQELSIGFGRASGGGHLTRLAKQMLQHLDEEMNLFSRGARWR